MIQETELIHNLKEECQRVKLQRNEYEQQLIYANRRINRLKAELNNINLLAQTNKYKKQ